jgi:hypothetical protein
MLGKPTTVVINKVTFIKLSYIRAQAPRSIPDYINRRPNCAFKHFVPCHYAVIFTIVIYDSVIIKKFSM